MGVFFLVFFLLFSCAVFTNIAFATSYDINIPTGSASPSAQYFWQNEKSGLATGVIEILVGDTVVWKNGDQAQHTVTSGTPNNGPDNIFGGSNLLAPGDSYQFKFDKEGQYPYYCLIHPWMIGTVFVIDGYQIIPNVGKTIGDGSAMFDVEYQFDRLLSLVAIDERQKLLTFEIIGNRSDNDVLKIRLPTDLIDGPFVIIVDGKKITDFEQFKDDKLNILSITMPENSKSLTIIGTTIVPEFGTFPIIILLIAIVCITLLGQKSRIKLKI